MRLTLSPTVEKWIERRLRSKRYTSAEDVVQAGLVALELQDSYGDFRPSEMTELLKEGERSITNEGTVEASEVFADLRRRSRKLRRSRKAG